MLWLLPHKKHNMNTFIYQKLIIISLKIGAPGWGKPSQIPTGDPSLTQSPKHVGCRTLIYSNHCIINIDKEAKFPWKIFKVLFKVFPSYCGSKLWPRPQDQITVSGGRFQSGGHGNEFGVRNPGVSAKYSLGNHKRVSCPCLSFSIRQMG